VKSGGNEMAEKRKIGVRLVLLGGALAVAAVLILSGALAFATAWAPVRVLHTFTPAPTPRPVGALPAKQGAAATAAAMSSALPRGTVPITSPVAGFIESQRSPDLLSTHSPPIYSNSSAIIPSPPICHLHYPFFRTVSRIPARLSLIARAHEIRRPSNNLLIIFAYVSGGRVADSVE